MNSILVPRPSIPYTPCAPRLCGKISAFRQAREKLLKKIPRAFIQKNEIQMRQGDADLHGKIRKNRLQIKIALP
jgi:hypothetical protein